MSTHQLYLHVVWTTLGRRPMINAPVRSFLEGFLRTAAQREHAQVVSLAILKTHVHILLRIPGRIDLPKLVQLFKGGLSYAANRIPGSIGLRWAREYSATTVRPRQLDIVMRYIAKQGERHPGEAVAESTPQSSIG